MFKVRSHCAMIRTSSLSVNGTILHCIKRLHFARVDSLGFSFWVLFPWVVRLWISVHTFWGGHVFSFFIEFMPRRKMSRSNGSFAFNCLPKGFHRFTFRGSDSATPCHLPPDFLIIRSSLPGPHEEYPSESGVWEREPALVHSLHSPALLWWESQDGRSWRQLVTFPPLLGRG